jgi:alkylation response protein AidB-like acyl-CoA dehydrogenase
MACDLNLGEDLRQMLDAAAAMLATHYPVARRRQPGQDNLAEIAGFGLFGLAVGEEQGEAGASLVEEALLHVLLGRHVVSSSALAAALAARVSAAAGRRDLADAIVAGERAVCAAIQSGETLLLPARGDAGLALLFGNRELALVDLAGADTAAVPGLGHSVSLERLAAGSPAQLAGASDTVLLDIADLLVSAQLLGVAEAARDLGVDYAKVRQQFGQPIGAFQAVKHHCADMAVAAEMASAQLDMAAIALRDGRPDASFQVAALRRLATHAAFFNARTAVQVHGGIGFSAEADVHHYLKQAHLLSRLGAAVDMLSMPGPMAAHAAATGGH